VQEVGFDALLRVADYHHARVDPYGTKAIQIAKIANVSNRSSSSENKVAWLHRTFSQLLVFGFIDELTIVKNKTSLGHVLRREKKTVAFIKEVVG
jgi:hypothetical protein